MESIQFFGASGTVTGSNYVLTAKDGEKIVIDLGMFQGEAEENNSSILPFTAKEIAGVLLTHAHLDHCGRLPLLVKSGFSKKIYMTAATRKLIEIALLDAAKIEKEDHKALALYTEEDVWKLLGQTEVIAYEQQFSLGSFQITFHNAGHILGSAALGIIDTAGETTYVFSGDLGNKNQDLVALATPIAKADIVVMESTYGDRLHPKENIFDTLQREINAVENSGGVLLIPAFSLDRTQSLLHRINHLKHNGKIRQQTPVFLDSPLAIKATEIYKQFPDMYGEELTQHAKKEDPFNFPGLSITQDKGQSREIEEEKGTKVIIAGNGMMAGGRIDRHAAIYLPLPTTRLLLVGFQAPDTLGYKLLFGSKRYIYNQQEVVVNATINHTGAMSGHADQQMLLDWLQNIKGVKQVYLVHGEDSARNALQEKITEALGIKNVLLPVVKSV